MVADEGYIRESILNPAAKVVAGYQPIMPTYQGQVSEEQLIAAHRLHQVACRRPGGGRAGAARAAGAGDAPRGGAGADDRPTADPTLPKRRTT